MPLSPANSSVNLERSDKPIWYFLFFWTLLNAIQAYILEVHADEAYYWLYSKFLDWGYFDHPPMVAIFIKIGDSLIHNEFGLRLMTVISSTISVYILWLIVKKYRVEAKWFILVVSGIFVFHIYGFTTTPDAPLFLFTALFYFVYQKYLEEDKFKWTLLLILIIAGLLYSKYHGILLIVFTLLANLSLLKRRSFWAIVVLSAVLYIPHILWQVNHGYPSINYHLFEQVTNHYDFSQTYTYFPGQLLMAGPLIGWFLFYGAFRVRVKDKFTRCLMVNCIGTFAFFLISSIKGEVQPQWTLIAFAPLSMLVLICFKQMGSWKVWFERLAIVNLGLILLVRIAIIDGSPLIRKIGQVKSLYGFRSWAKQLKQKVGDNYLIMDYGFQNPSKYDFYNNTTTGFDYDSKYYHLSQFDIWPIEDSLQGKKAYYLVQKPIQGIAMDTVKTEAGIWYGRWIDSVRTYQKVLVELSSYKLKMKAGQKATLDLTITNPYDHTIDFSNINQKHKVFLGASLNMDGIWLNDQQSRGPFNKITLKPGESTHYSFILVAPTKKGIYNMMFYVRTTPFPGGKNSHIISLTVE